MIRTLVLQTHNQYNMQLLTVRYIQLKRELRSLGIIYTLLLVCMYALLVYFTYRGYSASINGALICTAMMSALCYTIHITRTDKTFVYTHLTQPRKQLCLEYSVLVFPFAITSMFTTHWYFFFLLIGIIACIPYVTFSVKQHTYLKNISRIIPSYNFEWISGFRKSFLTLLPIYACALGVSWFKIAPLVFLFILSTSISAMYAECEPLHIVAIGNLSPRAFLRKKMSSHSLLLVLFFLPVLVINTLFNTDYWFINLFFMGTQLALLCLAITLKYTMYVPNKNLSANSIILGIVSAGCVIPFLLPIPTLMALRYYKKAKQNLTHYLYD
jgi:hypothetical protein